MANDKFGGMDIEIINVDDINKDELKAFWEQTEGLMRDGLVLPSEKPNELDYLNLREKMTIPELPLPTKAPDLSFKIKISKRRLRKIRPRAIWKKPRLPRKLKKAARHADFDMMDPLFKTDALSDRDAVSFTIEYDMRVRIHPASYPRTKWVHRLTRIVRRMMARQHRRFIQHQLNQQYLDQHPGMLTYDDAPSNPAGHNKNLYAGNEFILDKDSRQRLANILINKEEKNE